MAQQGPARRPVGIFDPYIHCLIHFLDRKESRRFDVSESSS
jgi:hypothetical protein